MKLLIVEATGHRTVELADRMRLSELVDAFGAGQLFGTFDVNPDGAGGSLTRRRGKFVVSDNELRVLRSDAAALTCPSTLKDSFALASAGPLLGFHGPSAACLISVAWGEGRHRMPSVYDVRDSRGTDGFLRTVTQGDDAALALIGDLTEADDPVLAIWDVVDRLTLEHPDRDELREDLCRLGKRRGDGWQRIADELGANGLDETFRKNCEGLLAAGWGKEGARETAVPLTYPKYGGKLGGDLVALLEDAASWWRTFRPHLADKLEAQLRALPAQDLMFGFCAATLPVSDVTAERHRRVGLGPLWPLVLLLWPVRPALGPVLCAYPAAELLPYLDELLISRLPPHDWTFDGKTRGRSEVMTSKRWQEIASCRLALGKGFATDALVQKVRSGLAGTDADVDVAHAVDILMLVDRSAAAAVVEAFPDEVVALALANPMFEGPWVACDHPEHASPVVKNIVRRLLVAEGAIVDAQGDEVAFAESEARLFRAWASNEERESGGIPRALQRRRDLLERANRSGMGLDSELAGLEKKMTSHERNHQRRADLRYDRHGG